MNKDLSDSIITILVITGILMLIVWAIRSICLWYWRVNDVINELKLINKNLTNMEAKMDKLIEK